MRAGNHERAMTTCRHVRTGLGRRHDPGSRDPLRLSKQKSGCHICDGDYTTFGCLQTDSFMFIMLLKKPACFQMLPSSESQYSPNNRKRHSPPPFLEDIIYNKKDSVCRYILRVLTKSECFAKERKFH